MVHEMFRLFCCLFLAWFTIFAYCSDLRASNKSQILLIGQKYIEIDASKIQQALDQKTFPLSASERDALQKGKEIVDKYRYNRTSEKYDSETILCALFYEGSSEASILLNSNVLVSKSYCHWAILLFSVPQFQANQLCSSLQSIGNIISCQLARASSDVQKTEVALSNYCGESNSSGVSFQSSEKYLPRSQFYTFLSPYLPKYDRVLLMDSDYSLINFNLTSTLDIWSCAFSNPPLIVQPLVFGSKQYYSYTKKGSLNQYYATGVSALDNRLALISSVFLQWLIANVIPKITSCSQVLGIDGVLPSLWCSAGRDFGREVLGWTKYDNPCGLILDSSHFHRINIQNSVMNPHEYPDYSRRMEIYSQFASSIFDSWSRKIMYNFQQSEYRKIIKTMKSSSLIPKCINKRKELDLLTLSPL